MSDGHDYKQSLDQYANFDPTILADPYSLFHQLRTAHPVLWSDSLNCWVLTRYTDVLSGLRDPRLSSNRMTAFMDQLSEPVREQTRPLRSYLSKFMGLSDPPNHTRIRRLVNKAFTPRVVQGMRQRIEQLVEDLLEKVDDTGRMDLISDLAHPLPVVLIAEVLGLPAEDRKEFKQWSDDIVAFLGTGRAMAERAERAQRSMLDLTNYYRGIMAQRRKHPKDDLISSLLAAEEDSDKLSEEELLATCVTLLSGGHETTTNLIGNGMLALLRNPEELQKLSAHPSLIVNATEELLRYDSPVQRAERVAIEEFEIDGKAIEKGQRVFLMLGAANRDPLQFPAPDRLDIARKPNRHIAFGLGIHFCVGAPLTRLEGQIAIDTLLRRLPQLRLVSERLEWQENIAIRGLNSLPVVFK